MRTRRSGRRLPPRYTPGAGASQGPDLAHFGIDLIEAGPYDSVLTAREARAQPQALKRFEATTAPARSAGSRCRHRSALRLQLPRQPSQHRRARREALRGRRAPPAPGEVPGRARAVPVARRAPSGIRPRSGRPVPHRGDLLPEQGFREVRARVRGVRHALPEQSDRGPRPVPARAVLLRSDAHGGAGPEDHGPGGGRLGHRGDAATPPTPSSRSSRAGSGSPRRSCGSRPSTCGRGSTSPRCRASTP